MQKSLLLKTTKDQASLSSDLEFLIGRWERIQTELERVAQLEFVSIETASEHSAAISELEDQLIAQEKQVLDAILNFECRSLSDGLAKMRLWKQIIAPPGASIECLSLPEQIALSALRDLEQ